MQYNNTIYSYGICVLVSSVSHLWIFSVESWLRHFNSLSLAMLSTYGTSLIIYWSWAIGVLDLLLSQRNKTLQTCPSLNAASPLNQDTMNIMSPWRDYCVLELPTLDHVSSKGALCTTKRFNVRTSMVKRMKRVVKKNNQKFYLWLFHVINGSIEKNSKHSAPRKSVKFN